MAWKQFLEEHKDVLGVYHGRKAFTGPELVSIDLTADCNNSCIGCWCFSPQLGNDQVSGAARKLRLSKEVMATLVSEFSSMGVKRINLSGGGEPTFHPDFMEICRIIKSRGIHLNVNTAFTLLHKKKLDLLKEYGLDHLHVSLWASNADTYVKTHPNQGKKMFEHIKQHLPYVSALGIPFNIYHVISNVNFREVEEMVRFGEEVGAQSVEFTLMDIIPGKTEMYALDDGQRKWLLEEFRRIRSGSYHVQIWNLDDVIARLDGRNIREGTVRLIDSLPCVIGWNYCRILPNGDVAPCCKGHNKPLGNVYQQSFRTIWHSKVYNHFRHMAKTKKKSHPYFKEINCYRACDNVVNIRELLGKMDSLSSVEKLGLKVYSKVV